MTKMSKLYLLGGKKLINKKFPIHPSLDKKDFHNVISILKSNHLSGYVGATSKKINKILTRKSNKKITFEFNNRYSFLGGPQVQKFSKLFSKKFKCKYVIPVNSATSALRVGLLACDILPDDEVIVPLISYSASCTSILSVRALPIFVDVHKDTGCIDESQIEKKISKKTKAILAVHLLGNVCEMKKIKKIAKKYDLKIIEDTAQAIGSMYSGKFVGTIGHIGVFSFQQSKNLATGEGGLIATNDKNIAKKCRRIINHGELTVDMKTPNHDLINIIGENYRMTEITACIGISQLKKIDKLNQLRAKNNEYLKSRLRKFEYINFFENKYYFKKNKIVPHLLYCFYDENKTGISRDVFVKALNFEGVPAGTGYTKTLDDNPIIKKKIAFGKNKSPFTKNIKINKLKKTTVASELINKKYIWIYCISYPSKIIDMQLILRAFDKVHSNLDELKKINFNKTYRLQGRVIEIK